MMNRYELLLLVSIFIASLSQILLKKSALKEHSSKIAEYINIYVIGAYAMFFLSTLLTVFSLKAIHLNKAAVFESIGYVYIVLLSRIILKEKMTFAHLAGNFLIITGIIIFNVTSIL